MLDPPFHNLPRGVILTHITGDPKCVCENCKQTKIEPACIFQKFQEHRGIVAVIIKSCSIVQLINFHSMKQAHFDRCKCPPLPGGR